MTNLRFLLRISATAIVIFFAACSSQNQDKAGTVKNNLAMQIVVIQFGESGPKFAERYPGLVRIQRHPAGLDFYKVNWERPELGIVKSADKKHPLTIDNVIELSTIQDNGPFVREGLSEFFIYAGMNAPDLISHDDARLRTYAILQTVLAAGWQQVIERSEPRLKGKDRLNHTLATSNLNGLDARYLPTFEEWMRIESRTPWTFYANGIYLDVDFTRERTLTDPQKLGSYLLTYRVKTETAYFRELSGPEPGEDWRARALVELQKLPELRQAAEAKLRASSLEIDESYRDPPLPDAFR